MITRKRKEVVTTHPGRAGDIVWCAGWLFFWFGLVGLIGFPAFGSMIAPPLFAPIGILFAFLLTLFMVITGVIMIYLGRVRKEVVEVREEEHKEVK
jgi:uncharacterized membrane protein (DUF485 family)